MVWGSRRTQLADNFRGGKYVPRQVRPISVPLTDREPMGSPAKQNRSGRTKSSIGMAADLSEVEGDGSAPDGSMTVGNAVEPEHTSSGLVEQRRLEVEIIEAVNLPIMDDEAGATCDPYVIVECCGNEAKTKHVLRTLEPVWREKHVIKLPLDAVAETLNVTVMDYDDSAHDIVGRFVLRLGSKTEPFPDVENKYVNRKVTMAGDLSTVTFEGWYALQDPGTHRPVYGLKGQKSMVKLHIQHIRELRDVRYRPTPDFLQACSRRPAIRTRQDVRRMTHEIVACMPASSLLSSRLVRLLCTVGELKEWKKHDVVQLQNMNPVEDSLHFILTGTYSLYAQQQGGNAAMYRVLKGRSFGPQTSFGPQIGWCGPGEAFGAAALHLHEGVSATSVCMSDSGMTLLIDRRQCERVMEPFVRRESGYSPALHGSLLAENPKASSSASTLINFFKQSESRLFSGAGDNVIHHIVQECELVKLRAGDVLDLQDQGDESFYMVCFGTLSAHACVRSAEIQHLMPIQGECTDLVGAGKTFGVCAHEGACLRAREYAEVIRIRRHALIDRFGSNEPFSEAVLASYGSFETPGSRPATPPGASQHSTTARPDDDDDQDSLREDDNLSKGFGGTSNRLCRYYRDHPHNVIHQRQSRKGLLYTMHLFEWLRNRDGLQRFDTETIWILVQNASVCYLDCELGSCMDGFAIVLHGTAKVTENVSSEKPVPVSFFEAGRGSLLPPGSHIAGEVNGAAFVTALLWSKSLWDYAVHASATREACSLKLTIGTEGPAHHRTQDLCSLLQRVPILQHVPTKVLADSIAPHVRLCNFADFSVISSEGEEDFTLYVILEGSVLLYQEKDSEDPSLCAGLRGLDTLRASFGTSEYELSVGDCFGQMEVMLRSANSFTAVCKGPSQVLLVDSAILDRTELASMIWLSIDRGLSQSETSSMQSENSSVQVETTRMRLELLSLRTYQHAKSHKICQELSERSAIFMCSHMQTKLVPKDDFVLVRNSSALISSGPYATSIAAVVSGQLTVYPVLKPARAPDKPTLGSALCSLRTGDIYDPHLAKIEEPSVNADTKMDQIALAREDSECYVVDATKYRAAIKKNMFDRAVQARAMLQRDPLFNNLASFTFDKLSKLARLTRRGRDERVFSSSDSSNDQLVFLAQGDFKVTKKATSNKTMARLGQGIHLGGLPETGVKMEPMAVFATTDSLTMQFSIKELMQLLPDDVIRKLRQHLNDDRDYITSKMRAHANFEAPSLELHSQGTTDVSTSAAGIPVRQQHKGTAGLPLYQSTYCSGGMTIFFENVARGKVIPLPEDETEDKQKLGRPPEEVLPSLRGEFQRKKVITVRKYS